MPQLRQKIIKLGKANFRVFWETKETQALRLNFNPLLNEFPINTKLVFLHWQARPFGLRRWGVYDSVTDEYYGIDHDRLTIDACCQTLQLDEKIVKTLPTAVLVFKECQIAKNAENIRIGNND